LGFWNCFIHGKTSSTGGEGYSHKHAKCPTGDPRYWVKLLVGAYLPGFVFHNGETAQVYPYGKRVLKMLSETGYFHLQATKPTTVGVALEDSPVGLAAYILEKFSSWTNISHIEMQDGGFEKTSPWTGKFTKDELLTNIMIYWHTNSITSSMFLYKNSISQIASMKCRNSISSTAFGAANFPNDLGNAPLTFMKLSYINIHSYTNMPRGGHFAAFEEPGLLAHDLKEFLKKTEKWYLRKENFTPIPVANTLF